MTAGILLAAGLSRRFGSEDKLLAPLDGKPLIAHAADALRALSPRMLIAVTRCERVAAQLPDFHIARPGSANAAQSDSLRAGVALADAVGAQRALIVLGDMPHVSADLMRQIVTRCTASLPSAASLGQRAQAPSCWPRASFPALLALQGDQGGRALLQNLPPDQLVRASSHQLRDIDTPADLDAARVSGQ